MSKLTTYAVLFVMLLSLAAIIYGVRSGKILSPRAATNSVGIVFAPSSTQISVGKTFDVEINLATGMIPEPKFAAATFILQFNPQLLAVREVKRIELANTPEFESVEVLDQTNKVNSRGELHLLALNHQSAVTGPTIKVARVKFAALTPGTAELRIKYDSANPNTQPMIVQNTPSNQILPVSATLPLGRYTITAALPTTTPSPTPTSTPSPSATPSPSPSPSPVISSPTPSPTVTPARTTVLRTVEFSP